MAIKIYKPTTPGRRQASVVSSADLTEIRPEKSLLVFKKSRAGRNNQGKITIRHQGGGHKRFYRLVDFRQDRFEVPAKVLAIAYDPNRSARIALIQYQDRAKSYIIAPLGLKVGDGIVSSKLKAEIKIGNRLPLKNIPTGIMVHNIELQPGSGGIMARSAGNGALVMGIEGGLAQLKLPSGEIRLVPENCLASIGQVSNIERSSIRLGKAGRKRWLGIRPTVRGKAMNPVDHPHGGGEGVQPIGLVHPKTPWGRPALGLKTRPRKKKSNRFIIKRRK